MATTFTKLRNGSWGVRTTEKVRPGDTVEVTTKAGETRIETIAYVVWSGEDRETGAPIALCAIVPTFAPRRAAAARPPRTVRHSTQRIGRSEERIAEFAEESAQGEGWDF